MAELLYFDCNASYGPRSRKHVLERWTLEHLLDDLDLAGIGGALVLHAQALEYDPMLANRRLVAELEPHRGRLFPCWLAMPSLSGEFPSAAEFSRLAQADDIRAVRIEPFLWDIPLREAAWGEIRDAVRDSGMLVTASVEGARKDFDKLEQFLDLFGDCNVVLMNAHWRQWRTMVHVMNVYENAHVEFSAFQANRAIEYFSEHYGADRCLFGTGLPKKAPGAARGFLDWTLLPREQAAMVAGGNLARLLNDPCPQAIPAQTRWEDSLTTAARRGDPLPCTIMDDHCHILHDGGSSGGREDVMVRGDADGMVELIRKVGIDKTAIMSWAGPLSGEPDLGNRIVADAVARYPDAFVGVATVVPELQTDEEIKAVIQTYHVEQRFPGLKAFAPRQTIEYDDPAFDRWYRYADENRLYLVYDPKTIGPPGTPIIENLARKYPNMGLHLDHCGRSWNFALWAVDMVSRFPNVWAQMNYTAVTNGVMEYMAEHVGADRMLFGTDSPMRDPRPQAGWLVFTRLPEEDKRKIFGLNFQAILDQAFS